jgi:cytoskeletal protein CcmA (bactofilin family)
VAFNPPEDVSINTLLGPGSFIRGEVKITGFVRVDGDLDGNLETSSRVIVGEDARIRGNIRSRIITVGGVVQGDIIAQDGVHILSTGMVIGDVITRKLQVAESVILNGSCFAVDNQERFEEAVSKYNNRKALRSSTLASGSQGQGYS